MCLLPERFFQRNHSAPTIARIILQASNTFILIGTMEARKHTNGFAHAKKKASTSDILGNNSQPKEISGKWRNQYANLLAVREHMLHQKNNFVAAAKEEQPVFSLHEADAGTDQYDMDFALSMVSAEQDVLYEIEQALTRIRNGTYGVCEITGAPIEAERLTAVPWTRYSTEAQRQLEKNGGAGRIRLAERGSFSSAEKSDSDEEESEGAE